MRLHTLMSLLSLRALEAFGQQQWPLHDNGFNKVVQWDHYSYIIKGQRLFVWSGEMHYWRIPVPELWIDVLQKVKAAGFNTVSFYSHWGYHSASEDALDFESGSHDFTKLFDIAKEVGLYVLFRPGPYVNAETSAGGFPGWVTTGGYGTLRNNDSRYTDAWTPFFSTISQIVSEYQITTGGHVFLYQLENEYGNQWRNPIARTPNYPAIDYMERLQSSARENGIDVPLIHNNPNFNTKSWSKDYSNEGGNVDNYALDHYPSCWSCDLSECTGTNGNVPDFTTYDYFSNFQQVAPTQPSFLAEFQGGSYNPWPGPEGGCTNTTGPNWVNVFYRHNIGQKVTSMNVYMIFGGTNWGGLPFPLVGTSYDYSAPITESRTIGDKFQETKLFGQFLRVARDLTKVDRIRNSTNYASTSDIFTTELRNPDTNGAFYVTAHTFSPSTALTTFKLKVSTSVGNLTIPQYNSSIVLNGRESKILVTDFKIGNEKLIYSTAEVLTVSVQGKHPLVFLWLPAGESGEFFLGVARHGKIAKGDAIFGVTFHQVSGGIVVSYTQIEGSAVLEFDNHVRVVLLDRNAAYHTWMPSTSTDPYTPDDSTVVVQGPYLVRSAKVEGNSVKLTGDWSGKTRFEVFVPSSVRSVIFNGKKANVEKTSYGSLVGTLTGSPHTINTIQSKLPTLVNWKVKDGLPERSPDYNDSRWIVADHNSTQNPTVPATYPVLYASDYGFHTGNILWRGRFKSSNQTGVKLSIIGGTSVGWGAYLNGAFIGSWLGSNTVTMGTLELSFANATLKSNSTNVLFIIQDHMGKDQTSGATNARGIYNATLIGGGLFSSWKVAGKAGAETNIDPVRGNINEGGLHAERLGWHLPGFDDSSWESGSLEKNLTSASANFYRTVVSLDIPTGVDLSLGFTLSSPPGSKLRAQLYVNGYMFAKYIPHIGNQVFFPVFPGILDYHGNNTIGLSVWAQSAAGASVSVGWKVVEVVESSFKLGDTSYLRPGWKDRSQYY
ncbi:putative beta-galactosidase [Amylocarpus encephaloides]|uniref:beta-galactosidase n=1 Tax=Amylocarpus encephaloides TaxID=45428 RepID=A0A9P7YHE0_9HELO|nr:putative beta-galactosidase [Amylocarpus encephaloides]